ncbi:MAG: bifunctional phosphopantothenoylcysteine decarboxylase/phosphopantothenate--cysteine ligase CoaBC [Actinomycetes bacterium]
MFPRGREVILGVGGGISAYKSADLIRRLQDHGFLVTVIPTRSSQNFVGNATWAALSGRPVYDDLWSDVHSVPHISLAKSADAIVIAPTTADLLARIAQGRADDLLTNILLATTSPILLVPAMHPEMWLNAATQANVATLRSRGIVVLDPDEGRMTGSDTGIGRYPESSKIIGALNDLLSSKADLIGRTVLVTAGGTQEPIDPVRYIGNRSTGKQGYAVAYAAAARGATVTLIAANSHEEPIEGITTLHVQSADQMHKAVLEHFDQSNIVVMTAAVADAKPLHQADLKIEKASYHSIELTPTVDILKDLGERKQSQILVGFAAQTGDGALEKATEKYRNKKLDLIYVNDVSGGAIFGSDQTSGSIVDGSGVIEELSGVSKVTLAHKLLDLANDKLS